MPPPMISSTPAWRLLLVRVTSNDAQTVLQPRPALFGTDLQ